MKDQEPTAGDVAICAHHWMISTPSGELSVGTCRVCGMTKDFSNSQDVHWSATSRTHRAARDRAAAPAADMAPVAAVAPRPQARAS